MKKLQLSVAFLVFVSLVGCTTVSETGRKQFNIVSGDQEMKLGLTSFDQMKKEVPVSKDAAANALVQRVGQKIAAVAELTGAQWEFVVFESKEANAFCLPGGKVGVYTGILPITKDEAGLATVIGHEVAHAVAHHGAERMSQAKVVQGGEKIVGALSANATPITQQAVGLAYGLTSQVGVLLPFSRAQESEADHIGLKYMARAGYDPSAAVEFWQRFSEFSGKAGGSSMPALLRTHPVDSKRIEDLKKWLPEAQAELGGKTTGAKGSDVIGK
ncbi:MAG: M48 family metallopeptidase [Verrucomicrobiota bacterium]